MINDFTRLISALTKLPGIGKKSATRLSYFLLKNKDKQEICAYMVNGNDKGCTLVLSLRVMERMT